ncbi:unnamed protein product [Ectocarpus fasciculatus]
MNPPVPFLRVFDSASHERHESHPAPPRLQNSTYHGEITAADNCWSSFSLKRGSSSMQTDSSGRECGSTRKAPRFAFATPSTLSSDTPNIIHLPCLRRLPALKFDAAALATPHPCPQNAFRATKSQTWGCTKCAPTQRNGVPSVHEMYTKTKLSRSAHQHIYRERARDKRGTSRLPSTRPRRVSQKLVQNQHRLETCLVFKASRA